MADVHGPDRVPEPQHARSVFETALVYLDALVTVALSVIAIGLVFRAAPVLHAAEHQLLTRFFIDGGTSGRGPAVAPGGDLAPVAPDRSTEETAEGEGVPRGGGWIGVLILACLLFPLALRHLAKDLVPQIKGAIERAKRCRRKREGGLLRRIIRALVCFLMWLWVLFQILVEVLLWVSLIALIIVCLGFPLLMLE